jgi:uncharacterized membrane protein
MPPIRAVGVTDHYSADSYERVCEAKRQGSLLNRSLIFPNIEMRLGIGTVKGRWVNLHLLVGPEDPDHLIELKRFLLNAALRSNSKLPSEGFSSIVAPVPLMKSTCLAFGIAVSAMVIPILNSAGAESDSRNQPRFVLRDLGGFPGSSQTSAADLNNAGQVTGYSTLDIIDTNLTVAKAHPFLYERGVMQDLGLLPGFGAGFPSRMNDRGDVLCVQFGANLTLAMVLYSDGNQINLTERLGADVYPGAINLSQTMVGARMDSRSQQFRAVIIKNGVVADLGVLDPDGASIALDVNDSDEAVGYADPDRSNPAILHAVYFANGTMRDLGVLPGMDSSSADRINRDGHIIGNAYSIDPGPTRHRGFFYRRGTLKDLGALPGDTDSQAFALNNRDHIVGYSSYFDDSDGLVQRAMLFIDGRMWDLNALVPPDSGWTLQVAVGINDADQILVLGERRGEEGRQRSCLLEPVQRLRH